MCRQKLFQQPVFTPLEGGVVVIKAAELFLILICQFDLHEPPQQGKFSGVGEDEGLAERRKLDQKLVEQAASAFIQVQNSFEVQHQVVGGVEAIEDVADDQFTCGEGQMPLELISLYRFAEFVQCLAFLRRAHAARVQFRSVEFEADDRTTRAGPVEQMHVETA